jgi:hypothetical protein
VRTSTVSFRKGNVSFVSGLTWEREREREGERERKRKRERKRE